MNQTWPAITDTSDGQHTIYTDPPRGIGIIVQKRSKHG